MSDSKVGIKVLLYLSSASHFPGAGGRRLRTFNVLYHFLTPRVSVNFSSWGTVVVDLDGAETAPATPSAYTPTAVTENSTVSCNASMIIRPLFLSLGKLLAKTTAVTVG